MLEIIRPMSFHFQNWPTPSSMLARWGSSQLNLGKVREESTKFGDESTKVRDDSTKDRDESSKVWN